MQSKRGVSPHILITLNERSPVVVARTSRAVRRSVLDAGEIDPRLPGAARRSEIRARDLHTADPGAANKIWTGGASILLL